jgi:hypothetical protein
MKLSRNKRLRRGFAAAWSITVPIGYWALAILLWTAQ